METQPSSLDQLKAFLNKLFQFESQDLDFGVYKSFIDKLLVETVESQLKTLADAQINEARDQLARLEREDIVRGWLMANEAEKKVFENVNPEKADQNIRKKMPESI